MNLDEEMFKAYAQTQYKIGQLKIELEDLGKQITEGLKALGVKNIKIPKLGTFTLSQRKNWSYSPAVKDLENKVKTAKKDEQESGVASYEITEHVRFVNANINK